MATQSSDVFGGNIYNNLNNESFKPLSWEVMYPHRWFQMCPRVELLKLSKRKKKNRKKNIDEGEKSEKLIDTSSILRKTPTSQRWW